MDYRFITAIREHIESLDLTERYDDVAVAGSTLAVSRPHDAPGGDFILEQVRISHELHGIRQVVLINHQNCGAYGEMEDASGERMQHETDLRKAAKVIQDRFPDLDVVCYFATLSEKGSKRTIGFEKV